MAPICDQAAAGPGVNPTQLPLGHNLWFQGNCAGPGVNPTLHNCLATDWVLLLLLWLWLLPWLLATAIVYCYWYGYDYGY